MYYDSQNREIEDPEMDNMRRDARVLANIQETLRKIQEDMNEIREDYRKNEPYAVEEMRNLQYLYNRLYHEKSDISRGSDYYWGLGESSILID